MYNRNDVNQVIQHLNRQVFVSEAHLQMAFATAINTDCFEVYPEFPAIVNNKQSEFDLLIKDKHDKKCTLIEFKYKTANNTKHPESFPISAGISVILKNQSAIDNGWYDSWKDINRIEQCVLGKARNLCIDNGFFILLTNEKGYWEKSDNNSEQAVIDLYMNQGFHKAGIKGFKEEKPYRGFRNEPINIEKDYSFEYDQYLHVPGKKYGEFRILIVEI